MSRTGIRRCVRLKYLNSNDKKRYHKLRRQGTSYEDALNLISLDNRTLREEFGYKYL